jgi:hypothetical protein
MSLLNKEVFAVDPTGRTLPNDGVTALDAPKTPEEWNVLKYELEQFVVEGEYREGLRRVLNSYLVNVEKQTQPACWVSGFYGSGKSHFLRVLTYLWTNPTIEGVAARSLVNCPDDVRDLLKELDSYAKRDRTVTFAAAGVMRRGRDASVAQPLLEIFLSSAGLPTQYGPAKFALWLREEGLWADFVTSLEARGKTVDDVNRNLFVSTAVREALLEVMPGFASGPADAGQSIRAAYQVKDISDDMVVDTIQQILKGVARDSVYGDQATLPLTLLVVDELQQYISDDVQLLLEMQNIVERLTKQFEGRLLVVAAGQSALTANEMLARFQDRFTVQVQLQSRDVETVVRQVVLRKNPVRVPELESALTVVTGEISRHLGGSKLAAKPADVADFVSDYPLLPTRRRFMESALRAVDRGAAGQLRSQLRVTLEAVGDVAGQPLGNVVPGDVIFTSKREDMLNQGVLLHDSADRIAAVRDGSPEGETRGRAVELVYLISQLDESEGVRPTIDTLADLMVTDLNAGSATLRASLPGLLEPLVGDLLILDDSEYRLQSPTDAEWNRAFKEKRQGYLINTTEQVHAREHAIKRRLEQDLLVVKVVQGSSNTPRKWSTHHGEAVPESSPSELMLWVRNGWETTDSNVRAAVGEQGQDSPMVTVLLPKLRDQDFKHAIADWRAAASVISTLPAPTTEEGSRARDAMSSLAKRAEAKVDLYAAEVLGDAQVLIGGGEIIHGTGAVASAVKDALGKAAVRKFPRFKDADHSGWPSVFKRAKEGNASALSVVGFSSEVSSHPVVKEIKNHIGTATQSGASIHKHFAAEPFGWPKDAINGALAVLLLSEEVSATDGATPVLAASLTETGMTKLNYKVETVTVSFAQKQLLKQLAGKLGAPSNPVDLPSCITALREAAAAAGGQAPLPPPPSTADLDILLGKFGAEQQVEVAAQVPELLERWDAWKKTAILAEARIPEWYEAEKLLRHAKGLPNYDAHKAALDAIAAQRSLLTDPNPVPPILAALRADLRVAIEVANDLAITAHKDAVDKVKATPQWPQLPDSESDQFLNLVGLSAPASLDITDDTRLLEALERSSLSARGDQAAAFAGKAGPAVDKLIQRMTPEAKVIRPQSGLIATEHEADIYLSGLRKRILEALADGHPVSIN